MLEPWDRGYYGFETIRAVKARGADWPGRTKNNVVLEPVRGLSGGSFPADVFATAADRRHGRDGVRVRVIEYRVGKKREVIRLVTSLLDPEPDPAGTLAALYQERWELELVFDEIKTHQLARPNGRKAGVRSQKPRGVAREIYGVALAHRVVRTMMAAAAIARKIDPDRLSFKNSLVIVRRRLPELAAAKPRSLPPLCTAFCSKSHANASRRARNAATSAA